MSKYSPKPRVWAAACALTLLATAAPADAQSRPKWEFEVHGTFVSAAGAPQGQSNAPVAGQTFTLGDGLTTSRAVPSWYFGDGARLLNQVMQLRGLTGQLSALDRVSWPSAGRSAGPQVGARLARQAKGNLWMEFSFDLGLDTMGFDQAARDQIEVTRAEFITAFTSLANSTSTLLPNPTVTSTTTIAPGGRRAIASGVIQYRGAGQGTVPYVLAGAGYAATIGAPTTLTLTGNYRLTTPSQAVIDETDTVRLEYPTSSGLVWVSGFGMMRERSAGSGYRVDVRVQIGTTNVNAKLYTAPASTATSPTGAAILNATSPGLQFSSNELRTNLSGTAWDGFDAFSGSKRHIQWVISAGYYLRF